MKNILIIYPHWPPSNLAGVHRPRLIANFLQDFGWHPIVLTVSADYYEEDPDPDIIRTVSDDVEVIFTRAFRLTKPRIIGDLGLRAFPFLYTAALRLIKSRQIDFIWVPIPSFYTSLLGRLLFEKTTVPYGIDYIDPWVRDISNRRDLRSTMSLLAAKLLEPIAVKKASLISGVSEAYYMPVLERNLCKHIPHVGMPYGFDSNDHTIVLNDLKLPWDNIKGCKPLVYAGAFLPNARFFIQTLFDVISQKLANEEWDMNMHLYFLGTGNYTGTSIAEYAEEYGINSIVHEKRERLPYLHVLNFLTGAFAVMAVGSTEKHYTASKIFQLLLSKRPVLSIFHQDSSAVEILQECQAEEYLCIYNSELTRDDLKAQISSKLDFLILKEPNWHPILSKIEKYSAKLSAKALIGKLNSIV